MHTFKKILLVLLSLLLIGELGFVGIMMLRDGGESPILPGPAPTEPATEPAIPETTVPETVPEVAP